MHSKSRGSMRTGSIPPIHKNIQASYRFTLSQAPPPLPQVNNCQESCTSLRGICRHQIQIAHRLHWTEIITGTPIGQGGHNMATNKLPKTVQGGNKQQKTSVMVLLDQLWETPLSAQQQPKLTSKPPFVYGALLLPVNEKRDSEEAMAR